jgi:hypothetical protein
MLKVTRGCYRSNSTSSWRGGRGSFALAALCVALAGCSTNSDAATSGSSKVSETETAKTAAASEKKEAGDSKKDPPTATAAPTAAADAKPVDVDAILGGQAEDSSGVLTVDISKADDPAPPLGGANAAPPEAKPGKQIEWLDAGNLVVPNPGWAKKRQGDLALLVEEKSDGGVVFTPFGTTQDGLKKVDAITGLMKLKQLKWSKAQRVRLGPDKIPAFVGLGKAVDSDNVPCKIFFALIITGKPQNLLAIGGGPEKEEAVVKTSVQVVANIKRKR